MARSRLVRALGIASAVIAASSIAGSAFAAGTNTTSASAAAVTLSGQTPWVAPGGDALFRLKIRGDVSGLEVAATIHRAVATRSQLTDTISGRRLGGVEGLVSSLVSDLPTDADGNRVLTISLQNPSEARNPARVSLGRGQSAIYPVDIELRKADGDTPVDHFVTHLPVLAPGIEPLTVAMVWRLDASPSHRPDGTISPASRRDLAPGGRASRIVDAITANADVPLTIAPTAETLEGWIDIAQRPDDLSQVAPVAQLRAMAGLTTRQFVTMPYAPIDMPSLEAAGLGDEVAAQFARAEDVSGSVLQIRPDPRTVLAGAVDATTLSRLREVGADRVLIDASSVSLATRLTPGRPFPITTRGRVFTAAVTDSGLRTLLDATADAPALRAQRFISGLLLVALEAPSDARGVVVETSGHLDAPSSMFSTIFNALRTTPALRADTIDGYFAHVAPEARSRAATLPPRIATDHLGVEPDSVRAARRQIDAFSHLVGDNDITAGSAERDLLLSETHVSAAADRRRAHSYLAGVGSTVRGVLSRVHGPTGRTVTLTARRANIPISLLNDNPEPLQVRVHLDSDKLLFPNGADRLITLPPHNTTERFPVEARTSGAFPLTITVTSPDGALTVTATQLTLRSTAVSGMGVFIAAGAGAFLFGWWGTHLRRRDSKRTRTLASPEPAGASGSTGATAASSPLPDAGTAPE